MVKTVRTMVFALASLAALACLAGCDLGASVFPGRLMSYEAYADLTRFIDPDHIRDYRFQIVRDSASTEEYLVLANDNGSWGDDCVVVFDADLKVQGHFTMNELDAMDPANPFGGRGAMVDSDGMIVVGNRRFAWGPRGLAYSSTLSFNLHNYGLTIPEAAKPNFSDIRAWSNSTDVFLEYDAWPAGWSGTPLTAITKFPGVGTWGHLDGVWLLATWVMLIADRDGMQPQIHLLPRAAFANLSLCDPLCYSVSLVPSPGSIWWETLGYTDEGFAVFRGDTSTYMRFDENGALIGTPLDVPEEKRPYNESHLYGRTSGWYVLDLKEMSLERRKWWWQ